MPSRKVNVSLSPSLRLRSDFECGSILYDSCSGVNTDVPSLRLCLAPDVASKDRVPSDSEEGCGDASAESVSSRMWYYFKVEAEPGAMPPTDVDVFIRCVATKGKLYPQGYKPVYRTAVGAWEPVPSEICFDAGTSAAVAYGGSVSFRVPLGGTSSVEVAFAVPYGLSDIATALERWEGLCDVKGLTFTRSVIARSLHGHPLDHVTISDPLHPSPSGGALLFSSRVHPSEVPASWMLHGLVESLVNGPNSHILKDFTVHIVPVINPDGVYNGYTRGDTEGRNLNRYYDTATAADHPTIHALRELFIRLHRDTPGGLYMYIDLHAHATRRGAFIFGNKLGNPDDAAHTNAFVDQMASRCPHFDKTGCNFTEKNMMSKGKYDKLSKQGSSRVALHSLTGHTRCYTFEVSYVGNRGGIGPHYTVETFMKIGQSIVECCYATWGVMRSEIAAAPRKSSLLLRRASVNKEFLNGVGSVIGRKTSIPGVSQPENVFFV